MGKRETNTLFGTASVSVGGVAMATASASGANISTLSETEMDILELAGEWQIPVPNIDFGQLSSHARADQFDNMRDALKKVMMQYDKGREVLGSSMLEPLKTEQDYKSILRRAFKKYTLGAGQENYIPIELDVQAYMISADGDAYTTTPMGIEGVEVPLQKIETEVYFSITDIRKGKYDLLGASTRKAEAGIFKEEDRRIGNLFRQVAASGDSNAPIGITKSDFKERGLYTIIQAVSSIEGQIGLTLNPTDIWMNPVWKQVFRTMTNYEKGFRVSFNTAEELMKKGNIAVFQGLRVNQSPMLKHDQVYVTADPEYFGAFVESVPLMVIDAVKGSSVGFVILEEVGFVITNPKGLATIAITA